MTSDAITELPAGNRALIENGTGRPTALLPLGSAAAGS
jgi:hypothetical protein